MEVKSIIKNFKSLEETSKAAATKNGVLTIYDTSLIVFSHLENALKLKLMNRIKSI